ncbi:MAG TPA: cytochrome C oxidase subunit IV family protein [Roseiflexaceae bacterium]|nr:cytochrome C oxidase subunit IV family protein [Roseiflexaceae bacterium]
MATTEVSHEGSTRIYWIIGAILAVITIVEVILAYPGVIYSPQNPDRTAVFILVPILLVLSIAKGSMVVMFFMHLRGDPRVYQLLFIAPFTLATSMILVFLALFSNYVGIGG